MAKSAAELAEGKQSITTIMDTFLEDSTVFPCTMTYYGAYFQFISNAW